MVLHVKYNELAWDIWRNLTEQEKADVAMERYPLAKLSYAVNHGYDLDCLKKALRRRTRNKL
jgi:hypothetical protein